MKLSKLLRVVFFLQNVKMIAGSVKNSKM